MPCESRLCVALICRPYLPLLLILCGIASLCVLGCGGNSAAPGPQVAPAPSIDTSRIKATAQAGKTYESIVKCGVDSQVIDKDWGVQSIVHMVYVAELALTRYIEENDGHTIVEVRTFDVARATKVESDVDISLSLGPQGKLVLGVLAVVKPGAAAAIATTAPLLKSIAENYAELEANAAATKAWSHVNTLQTKKVRITYVEGSGVTAIEPIGCTLTPGETEWIRGTAVLSDYYIMPELNGQPGDEWSVSGKHFVNMIDPELQGIPSGQIVLQRQSDLQHNGTPHARLSVDSGFLIINSSDDTSRRIGTFTPRGELLFSLDDQVVVSASFTGEASYEEVSKDHLLFEALFKAVPTVKVEYSCSIQ